MAEYIDREELLKNNREYFIERKSVVSAPTVEAITIDRLAEIMDEKFNYQFMSYYSKKDWKEFFKHYAEVEE